MPAKTHRVTPDSNGILVPINFDTDDIFSQDTYCGGKGEPPLNYNQRFTGIENRFDKVERRLNGVEQHLGKVETRLIYTPISSISLALLTHSYKTLDVYYKARSGECIND